MGLDMTFLKTATVALLDGQVHPAADTTHIPLTSHATGRAGEVPVNVNVSEAALLKPTPQGWRIATLTWTVEPRAAIHVR